MNTETLGNLLLINYLRPNIKLFCDIDYDPFLLMQDQKKIYGLWAFLNDSTYGSLGSISYQQASPYPSTNTSKPFLRYGTPPKNS